MPIERKDRVQDYSTTSGTGTLTLSGTSASGFRSFSSAHTTGATVRYAITASNGAWEVGEGVYTTAGNTLTRVTVFASSNAGALVNFDATSKVVVSTPTARDFNLSQTYSVTTTSTTANQVLATVDGALYRSVEFIVQSVDTTNSRYSVSKILAVHNGASADFTEYGHVGFNTGAGTYSVDYSGGNLRLLTTPTSSSSTVFKTTVILLEV